MTNSDLQALLALLEAGTWSVTPGEPAKYLSMDKEQDPLTVFLDNQANNGLLYLFRPDENPDYNRGLVSRMITVPFRLFYNGTTDPDDMMDILIADMKDILKKAQTTGFDDNFLLAGPIVDVTNPHRKPKGVHAYQRDGMIVMEDWP